jgi:hypothetical protein
MNNSEDKKGIEELKGVLGLGFSYQVISAVIGFAMRKNKTDFIEKLGVLMKDFQDSLSEEEKKELQEDISITLDKKSDEILDEMQEKMSDEEIDKVLGSL